MKIETSHDTLSESIKSFKYPKRVFRENVLTYVQ